MRFTKIIETDITVDDPIGVHADPQRLLRILKHTYEGKCAFQCKVLTVVDVIRYTAAEITSIGLPDHGTLHISFTIEALVYEIGRIVPNFKVTHRDESNILHGRIDNDVIIVEDEPLLNGIKIGNTIPIKIKAVSYRIGQSSVVLEGVALKHEPELVLYTLSGQYSTTATITELLERIAAEERLATPSQDRKPLSNALYAWKVPPVKPSAANLSTLQEIVSARSHPAYISRDNMLHLDTNSVHTWKTVPEGAIVIDNLTIAAVFEILLAEYLDYLVLIRNMIEIYNTKAIIDDHNGLWIMLKKIKL